MAEVVVIAVGVVILVWLGVREWRRGMWGIQFHDTITGEPLLRAEASEGAWRRALGRGGGQHTFPVQDRALGSSVWRQVTEPNACTLAVLWDGFPVYAGLVTRAVYEFGGALKVHHSEGFRALMGQRMTFGVGGYVSGDLQVTDRSSSGTVRAILLRALASDRGYPANWQLPLDLPEDGAGGFSALWRRWDFLTIEDLLTQVEGLGNQIDFHPYYDENGWLRFETRLGPPLPGGQFEWNVTAPQSAVSSLTVTTDGTKQLSGCFYIGKGSEADMLWGEAGFIPGPGGPIRDMARSTKDVDDTTRLTNMAMADLVEHRYPITQYDLTVDAGSVDVPSLVPGAKVRLESYGDPYLEDGARDLTVVGVSGDMSWTLKPEVQS